MKFYGEVNKNKSHRKRNNIFESNINIVSERYTTLTTVYSKTFICSERGFHNIQCLIMFFISSSFGHGLEKLFRIWCWFGGKHQFRRRMISELQKKLFQSFTEKWLNQIMHIKKLWRSRQSLAFSLSRRSFWYISKLGIFLPT